MDHVGYSVTDAKNRLSQHSTDLAQYLSEIIDAFIEGFLLALVIVHHYVPL
jgi:hypothetical protein